jgi:hypothetical protein
MSEHENTEHEAQEEQTQTNETPAERFSRIGSMRLSKVLDAMRVLCNCTGPTYEYTPEQVAKVDQLILAEHAKLMAAFRGERIVEKQPNLL